MNRLLPAALAALFLSGCSQIFDALSNSGSPHSLTASRGEGDGIGVSWLGPDFPESDTRKVDRYVVNCDGSDTASVTTTSWTDRNQTEGTRHSYQVKAQLSDGSWTGWSNTDTGWFIRATPLLWGTELRPQRSETPNSWFKTLVVAGWTYHLVPTSGAASAQVLGWDNLEVLGTIPPGGGVWTPSKTGKVWVKASGRWTGWYE